MEELSKSLASSFQIGNNPNDTSSPHPRLKQDLFKASCVVRGHMSKIYLADKFYSILFLGDCEFGCCEDYKLASTLILILNSSYYS